MAKKEIDYTMNDQRRAALFITPFRVSDESTGIETTFLTQEVAGLPSIFYQQTREGEIIAEGGVQGATEGSALVSLSGKLAGDYRKAERAMLERNESASQEIVVFERVR